MVGVLVARAAEVAAVNAPLYVPAPAIEVAVRPAAQPELRWVCATWSRAMRATTVASAMRRKSVRIGLRGDGV